jgi:VWFA-related protein
METIHARQVPARRSHRLVMVLWVWAMAGGAMTAVEEPPRDIGRKETVTVRLVTVDAVVVDSQDRTVPGLTTDDFTLLVDGRRVPIDTLDESCTGALEAPRAEQASAWPEPPPGPEPRRILFVFDYLHLPLIQSDVGGPLMAHTKVLQEIRRTVEALPPGDEEILIAVLDGGVRIEQPFTPDRGRVLATLARMEKDVTLYAGNFQHVTERPLFAGLEALVDLADTVPGSKALVLFTGGSGPGPDHDTDLKVLAGHASLARVSIYPVDCAGLGTRLRRIPFR